MTRWGALLCIAVCYGGASAAPLPHITPSLVLPSPGCVQDFEDHTGEPFDVCGYRSIALSEDASRILAIGVTGHVRLFDAKGDVLAELGPRSEPIYSSTAIIADRTALAIVGNQLIAFDASSGEALYTRRLPQHSHYEPEHVSHRDGVLYFRTQALTAETRQVVSTAHAVDMRTGVGLAERTNTGAILYGPTRSWAFGTAVEGVDGGYRHSVVLADPQLTRLDTPGYCAPFGPTPRCVMFNYNTRAGSIIDFATGEASPFDWSSLVSVTTFVQWFTVDNRAFALVRTGIRPVESGLPIDHWSLIAVEEARLITTFEGTAHISAIEPDPSGRLEIRLGTALQEYRTPFVVYRINLSTGERITIGTAPELIQTAWLAPTGGFFFPFPEQPKWTLSLDAEGAALAVLEFPTRSCNGYALWLSDDTCVTSDDQRTLAFINPEGGISLFRVTGARRTDTGSKQ